MGQDNTERVLVARSSDGGQSFDSPVEIDRGGAVGRCAVTILDDDSVIVAWLDSEEDEALLRIRRIHADGTLDPPMDVAQMDGSRSSGFPTLACQGGLAILSWTDIQKRNIRTTLISLETD